MHVYFHEYALKIVKSVKYLCAVFQDVLFSTRQLIGTFFPGDGQLSSS